MSGGGSSSSNDAIIAMQREEAANAEKKEQQRQARLKYGRDLISSIFDGGAVTSPGTTRTETVENPNAGRRPLTPAEQFQYDQAKQKARRDGGPVSQYWRDPRGASGPQMIEQIVEVPGETQEFAGIGQDFYENYRKSLQDFYVPTVEDQFQNAKQENLFDLARKGLIRSSVAADRSGELLKNKADADAQIQSQIEGQVSGLQSDVNNAKTKATQLLTATEDPTTAMNTALTEVNAIQSRSPQFSDLGNLFAWALNAYSTYRNAEAGRERLAQIPVSSPYASSGRVYG